MRTIKQAHVEMKRVIVRVDWNVTFGRALRILDDTRIVRTLPTIRWLIGQGAKQIILLSHLGKPGGKYDKLLSLEPVVNYASGLMGEKITLINQFTDVPMNQLVMLENLRFWQGEEGKDTREEFVKALAGLGDIYVNEAFGEAHRDAASITGIPQYLPSYAGLWFAEEVETIMQVREQAENPYVVIMGGAKVEDKSKLLEVLSRRADTILLGGKLANEYIEKGMRVGGKARIVLPVDGVMEDGKVRVVGAVRAVEAVRDIGPKTRKIFEKEIRKAKTIVWNGPMGMVEDPKFRAGTEAVYEAMQLNEPAFTMVGGGDTLASIGKEEHLVRIDHVSTGGGAMLALLEKGALVGIEAIAACRSIRESV